MFTRRSFEFRPTMNPWYRRRATWITLSIVLVVGFSLGYAIWQKGQDAYEISAAVDDGVDDAPGSAWRRELGEPPASIMNFNEAAAEASKSVKISPSPYIYSPTPTPSPVVYRMNEPVATADLTYTVTKVRSGISSVGTGTDSVKADGAFVLVDVTIKNSTSESYEFYSLQNTRLCDAQGEYYVPDDRAESSVNPWGRSGYVKVDSGESVEMVLAYDLPVGVKPAQLWVSDYYRHLVGRIGLS